MADLGVVLADIASILGSYQTHTYVANQVIRYTFFDSLPDITTTYGSANAGYFGTGPNGPGGVPYFAAFDPAQREKIREIFDQIERITSLHFELVGINENPDIRFGISEMSGAPSGAAAGVTFGMSFGQDIFLDDDQVFQLALGQPGYTTLIHEIGHALNLRDTSTGIPPLGIEAPNSHRVTVMADVGGSIDGFYGSSPLLLDIAALQERYLLHPGSDLHKTLIEK